MGRTFDLHWKSGVLSDFSDARQDAAELRKLRRVSACIEVQALEDSDARHTAADVAT